MKRERNRREYNRYSHWLLLGYDFAVYLVTALGLLWIYNPIPPKAFWEQVGLGFGCVLICRLIFKIYMQLWRYGGIQSYIRLIVADGVGCVLYILMDVMLPVQKLTFVRMIAVVSVDLLAVMIMRMFYHYFYRYCGQNSIFGRTYRSILKIIAGMDIPEGSVLPPEAEQHRIRVAIVGAGRVGVNLAEDLINNSRAAYKPVCFIEINDDKIGRQIMGLPILSEDRVDRKLLNKMGIQEIIFALPQISFDERQKLYDLYKDFGLRIKVYDYPVMQQAGGGKRMLREFDPEELLFRKPVLLEDSKTSEYYRGKSVLITGGGGSIGSELCRQLAAMEPRQIIILDIYENGAYDLKQELLLDYPNVETTIEICSVTDAQALEKVFSSYHPQIVLHAAAHKHVPLMEHNCCEAVRNNIFGTKTLLDAAEKFGTERFIMISTDKAVNPTSLMGATKRFCEMMALSRAVHSPMIISATRFGNVLGSAGSVIPLFKRQISRGGPVTLTDKKIIRYFMTIPEASRLVLSSGRMAANGELYVLDMGKPVEILALAESMIRMAGLEPYKDINIVEIGLRPGEKLYEELLVRSERCRKTENSLLFIEKDEPVSEDEISHRLEMLSDALLTCDDEVVRDALMQAVPEYHLC